MSINSEIGRLESSKQDIKNAIERRGVPVPESERLDRYAQHIREIQTGEMGPPPTLKGTSYRYQLSDSETVIPTGSWSTVKPEIPPKKYLWTEVTLDFGISGKSVFYQVTYPGGGAADNEVSVQDSTAPVPESAELVIFEDEEPIPYFQTIDTTSFVILKEGTTEGRLDVSGLTMPFTGYLFAVADNAGTAHIIDMQVNAGKTSILNYAAGAGNYDRITAGPLTLKKGTLLTGYIESGKNQWVAVQKSQAGGDY